MKHPPATPEERPAAPPDALASVLGERSGSSTDDFFLLLAASVLALPALLGSPESIL
jgi:hypothetical protein